MTGHRQIKLHGVDGSEWDLCEWPVKAGIEGTLWGTAPADLATQDAIGVPGSTVVGVRHVTRDHVVPLHLLSEDLEATLQALARATDPTRGPVLIEVVRVDGTSRVIEGYVIDGLSGLNIATNRDQRMKAALSLRCVHPYWRDPSPTTQVIEVPPSVWDTDEPSTYNDSLDYASSLPYSGVEVGDIAYNADIPYNSPVPYAGNASETLVMTIGNDADVTSWPTWTVTGPCGYVSAANITTGESWLLSDGLATGETLVINTRPGEKSVRINGQLAMPRLDDGATLWGLPPGESQVSITFTDRDASSSFTYSYPQEYLTC